MKQILVIPIQIFIVVVFVSGTSTIITAQTSNQQLLVPSKYSARESPQTITEKYFHVFNNIDFLFSTLPNETKGFRYPTKEKPEEKISLSQSIPTKYLQTDVDFRSSLMDFGFLATGLLSAFLGIIFVLVGIVMVIDITNGLKEWFKNWYKLQILMIVVALILYGMYLFFSNYSKVIFDNASSSWTDIEIDKHKFRLMPETNTKVIMDSGQYKMKIHYGDNSTIFDELNIYVPRQPANFFIDNTIVVFNVRGINKYTLEKGYYILKSNQ